MTSHPRLNTKEVALTTVFTALYAILGFIKISPIIGLSPQGITAAAIVAPIIGILLGPYIGTLSTFLGGVIGFSLGALSYPSLAAGIPTAFCAGMISTKRRLTNIVTYLALFLLFAFYPTVGPAWLFPLSTWFQIAGLIILVSPLQSVAGDNLNSRNNTRMLIGFFLTCLASTLAGQITGSLVFEALNPNATALLGNWQTLTFVYPVERTIIALAAMIIGASLVKILRTANLLPSAIVFKKADPPQKA
jgi:MFS family permease